MQSNSLRLASAYDCVLDCSDNPATRYLVSDACVRARRSDPVSPSPHHKQTLKRPPPLPLPWPFIPRPLVSGAAIGTDGQLTVYNFGGDGAILLTLTPRLSLPVLLPTPELT